MKDKKITFNMIINYIKKEIDPILKFEKDNNIFPYPNCKKCTHFILEEDLQFVMCKAAGDRVYRCRDFKLFELIKRH